MVYFFHLLITGFLMSHLRMSTAAVLDRALVGGNQDGAAAYNPGPDYFFTQSQWHAIAYVSKVNDVSQTVVEAGYVEPWNVFPSRIMKSVDYGMKFGIRVYVTEYEYADVLAVGSIKAGAIIELYDEAREDGLGEQRRTLGFYCVRYMK